MAIVGGGGLGKTTLAMEVYRKIRGNFRCGASVSVSRTLDLDKLFRDVLFQIHRKKFRRCQKEKWEKEQLISEIARTLTGKRYVVLDSSSINVTR
jgi:tRNA uridine 5-carbamoylmethylation protein Kti12